MGDAKTIGEVIDGGGIRAAILRRDPAAIAQLLGPPSPEWGDTSFADDTEEVSEHGWLPLSPSMEAM